jgi:uncharacterized protein
MKQVNGARGSLWGVCRQALFQDRKECSALCHLRRFTVLRPARPATRTSKARIGYYEVMESCEQIIIFTRCPEPGRVKTRLIPALGSRGAAELHRRLTERTIAQVHLVRQQRQVRVEIRYTGGSEAQIRSWLPGENLAAQTEGDLGARLCQAFADGFASGVQRLVAIGADCPTLSPAILTAAFEQLLTRDLVLGPARDGGYYLLGLSRPAPALFASINWGTGAVLAETVASAAAAGLSISFLEPLADVDRPEDLAHLGDHSRAR